MKPEHLEVLGALFDGESVDPSLLAEALADPNAAEVLADLAGLRILASADIPEPSEEFYARVAPLLNRPGLRRRLVRLFQPAIAASLLLAGVGAGLLLRPMLDVRLPPPPPPVREPRAPSLATVPMPVQAPDRGSGLHVDVGAPPGSTARLLFWRWQETKVDSSHGPE
jgi:hypothetical protein